MEKKTDDPEIADRRVGNVGKKEEEEEEAVPEVATAVTKKCKLREGRREGVGA